MERNAPRSIRSAVVVNLIKTITITLLSFISFPFAARALGEVGMGYHTYANAFVYYFLILSRLGIPNLATRECAKVRDDKVELSRKAQTFFIMQLITTLLSFVAMVAFVFLLPGPFKEDKMRVLIFLLSLNFLLGVFSFEWFYIALEKHFFIAIRSIIVITIGTLLTIALVRSHRHLFLYAGIGVTYALLTSVINIFFLHQNGFIFRPLGNYNFSKYWKSAFSIAVITILITLYNQTDTMILGGLDKTQVSTGSYSIGVKVVEIVITILTSLSAVFFPRAAKLVKDNNIEEFKNITKYSNNLTLLIGLPAVGLVIVLAPEIISYIVSNNANTWTSAAVENATFALVIIASIMLTYSIAENIYSQVLLPLEKEYIYLICLSIGVVFNIGGAFLLGGVVFKDRPLIGIAISTLVSDLIVLVPLLIVTRKITAPAIFNLNSLKIVLASIAISLIAYFIIPLLKMDALLKVIVVGVISGAVYVTILLLSKENIITNLLMVKKRSD